jgi:group II intron reverse transcriptase/maturase
VTERNPQRPGSDQTQSWSPLSPGAERIRQYVLENPREKLTALLHHVNRDTLRNAFYALQRQAAPGVDGTTWPVYEQELEENLSALLARIHRGAYRATPVRRVDIPKPDGGVRALGIASLEDKIVQRAVVGNILEPVYEAEFAGFSYGFRPARSAHDALDALAYAICERNVNWIVEVDIKGYFDNIDRERLMSFLEERVRDRRVLRLVRKWLGAGVMDAGLRVDPVRGTPQGAPISPLLANVYLHNVLDRWFAEEWRPGNAGGEAYIVRYADDFVLGFEHRGDAVRFLKDVARRFTEYGLELHPEKTRLIEFGREAADNRRRRGEGRPLTFDFLGLTHYCRTTRQGRFGLGRKPAAKRMQRTLRAVKKVLRLRMHEDPVQTGHWLGRVLAGWLGYYAVPTSYASLHQFRRSLRRAWLRSLRRRSQRDRFSWERLDALCAQVWPKTRILHPWPNARFAVKHSK